MIEIKINKKQKKKKKKHSNTWNGVKVSFKNNNEMKN